MSDDLERLLLAILFFGTIFALNRLIYRKRKKQDSLDTKTGIDKDD